MKCFNKCLSSILIIALYCRVNLCDALLWGESMKESYIYTNNIMRLTPEQVNIIKRAVVDTFGYAARIWLFGSRVDDHKRGGDIDLLIETEETDVTRIVKTELAFLVKLQRQLGEQKIDVLVDYPTRKVTPPIFEVAKQTGILL
jgi:predicted nucleotidyltransferase